MSDIHERLKVEHDIEQVRAIGQVLATEVGLLQQRLARLTSELAEERKISPAELFAQEAASHEQSMARTKPGGKGSERSPRNPRKDNAKPKPEPPRSPPAKPKQIVLSLDEADRICPHCGGELRHRPSLDNTSRLVTLEHHFVYEVEVTNEGYACTTCDCGHIEHAPAHEDQLVPGGIYSIPLIVQVLVFKYWQSMPLNRQVKFFAGHGLRITTQALWDNVWRATNLLEPVYDSLLARAQAAEIAHADETRWKVRRGKGKSWVWALCTSDTIVYQMRAGRSREFAEQLLGSFGGILVVDAMSAYTALVDRRNAARDNPELLVSGKPPPPAITLAGCWAHTRTYWVEAANDFAVKADPIISLIGKLFRIVEGAETHGLTDAVRDRWVETALATLKARVEATDVLPGSSLHAARRYTLNQWERLTVFATARRVPLTNNIAERALRTPVLGRLNFQGAKSERGNQAAQILYSLIATCLIIGVAPSEYLDAALRAAKERRVLTPHDFKAGDKGKH